MSDTTGSDTTVAGPADRYLDEVRDHLDHLVVLSDEERDELLDDLAAHLHEVAADDPRSLDETLGPPARFAAELLASAGLEGRAGSAGTATRLARLGAAGQRARDHRWTRAVLDFLPELRPAWWVLRGYLIVLGLAAVFTDSESDLSAFPVPSLGSPIVGLVAVAAAIVLSVRLGRSSVAAGAGRSRTGVRLLNGVAVVLALVALGHVHDGLDGDLGRSPEFVDPAFADPGLLLSEGLLAPDGAPITNLYAYDQRGELVPDVLLYDQDGRPIDVGELLVDPMTGTELTTDYPVDANGAQIRNEYPLDQRTVEWDERGVRRERGLPPPAVVVPPSTASTTTSTTAP